jgi:hypothetical protein
LLAFLDESNIVHQSQLNTIHSALSFFLGPLPSLFEGLNLEQSKDATLRMREVIKSRLLASGIDDKTTACVTLLRTPTDSIRFLSSISLSLALQIIRSLQQLFLLLQWTASNTFTICCSGLSLVCYAVNMSFGVLCVDFKKAFSIHYALPQVSSTKYCYIHLPSIF